MRQSLLLVCSVVIFSGCLEELAKQAGSTDITLPVEKPATVDIMVENGLPVANQNAKTFDFGGSDSELTKYKDKLKECTLTGFDYRLKDTEAPAGNDLTLSGKVYLNACSDGTAPDGAEKTGDPVLLTPLPTVKFENTAVQTLETNGAAVDLVEKTMKSAGKLTMCVEYDVSTSNAVPSTKTTMEFLIRSSCTATASLSDLKK